MNVLQIKLSLFFIFFFFISSSSIYSINVCGVNVDENNGFYVLDSSGNYVLAIDRQGDTFIQGSSGVSGGGSGVFEIAGTSFSFSSTDVSYSDSSQSMGSVPNSGFLVESSLGRVSQIDSSGNLRTQGLIAGEGSQGACNSDGWLYCSGGTRENRDYFCNVNGVESGVCTYSVDGSENCLTKSSVDSDGNSFNLGGFVRDYSGCNTGSCTFNDYGDYCSSTNIVVDYRDSGSGVSSSSYNCNGNNYYYCSGLTRRYVDYNCGAGSGGCVENSDTAVETCSAPGPSYGTWSCSDNFTAVRSMTTYSPSCSASGCGISSFTGTDTDSCGGGNICRPSSGCGAPSDCALEGDGTFVAHGDSITAYDSTSVSYGDSCNSQVRSCYDGVLSGSSVYGYGSCSVDPAQSCDLPWGGSVAHGSSVDAYSSSSVSYGNSCNDVKQTRTCTNGVLSGSYTNENCVVGNPSSCTLDGITKNHGESHTFYLSSSPTYPTLCEGISRTCDDGSFDGSNSYGESSCTDPTPSSCSLPWVGSVNHGDSVTAYQSSSVPYGNSCTSQTRTCDDGTLSGSYTHESCEIEEAASCDLPWGGSISHGSSVDAFFIGSVSYGNSCDDFKEIRTCDDGNLNGSYTVQNCVVGSAPVDGVCSSTPGQCINGTVEDYSGMLDTTWTCKGINNGNDASCDETPTTCTAYTSTGTQEFNDGDTAILYDSLTGPCDSATRTCNSGSWSGNIFTMGHIYTTCTEPTFYSGSSCATCPFGTSSGVTYGGFTTTSCNLQSGWEGRFKSSSGVWSSWGDILGPKCSDSTSWELREK